MCYEDANSVAVKEYLAIYTKCRTRFKLFFLIQLKFVLKPWGAKKSFFKKPYFLDVVYVTGSGLVGAGVAVHGIINTVASG